MDLTINASPQKGSFISHWVKDFDFDTLPSGGSSIGSVKQGTTATLLTVAEVNALRAGAC